MPEWVGTSNGKYGHYSPDLARERLSMAYDTADNELRDLVLSDDPVLVDEAHIALTAITEQIAEIQRTTQGGPILNF